MVQITPIVLDTFTLIYFGGFGVLFLQLYILKGEVSNLEGRITEMLRGELKSVSAILHSDHTPATDVLLEKFIDNKDITKEELITLRNLLENETGYDDTKKLAKAMVLKGIDYLLSQPKKGERWSFLKNFLCRQ